MAFDASAFVPDPEPAAAPAAPPAGAAPFDASAFVPDDTQGVLPTLEAGALGALDFSTLGIAGHLLSGTGIVTAERQAELKRAHPVASAVGGTAGLLAANLIPGVGEVADVGAAGEAAEGAGALAEAAGALPSNAIIDLAKHFVPDAEEGASALARMGTGAARGALEGALFAGGQTAGDVVANQIVGDPDHATEHLLAGGGMNILLGAALGGGLGGGISGLGVLRDIVGAAATRGAREAAGALASTRGAVALDVLGATASTLKRLYGKGDAGLAAIKAATGATGDDFPEVLGNILASPDAIATNPITGEAEPLIVGGDTAETVDAKIQQLRGEAGKRLQGLYEAMDKTGPGIAKQGLIDQLEAKAATYTGDPANIDTRNALRRIAAALGERDEDFIRPSDVWKLRINNDADIFRRSTGVLRENVDAELAYRKALNEAIDSYAEDAPTTRLRDPATGRFRPPNAGEAAGLATVSADLKRANALYSTWGELGRISKLGADTLAAKAPSLIDLATAGARGATSGARRYGLVGTLAGGLGGGAVGGAAGSAVGGVARVARLVAGPQMASRALEASRGLSDFLVDAAPRIRELVKNAVPDAVTTAFGAAGDVLPEAAAGDLPATEGQPWALPVNATGADVEDLDRRLQHAQGTTAELFDELHAISPGLAAGVATQGKGAAARLRRALPPNPYGHARGTWAPAARAVQAYNDYALGTVAGPHAALRRAAAGTATSALIAGAREGYPRMSARADALLADRLRNASALPRAARSGADAWFGSRDPVAMAVSNAVQRAAFSGTEGMAAADAPKAPGAARGRQLGQSRINKISSPTDSETATQGTTRRLGK